MISVYGEPAVAELGIDGPPAAKEEKKADAKGDVKELKKDDAGADKKADAGADRLHHQHSTYNYPGVILLGPSIAAFFLIPLRSHNLSQKKLFELMSTRDT